MRKTGIDHGSRRLMLFVECLYAFKDSHFRLTRGRRLHRVEHVRMTECGRGETVLDGDARFRAYSRND